MRLTALLRAAAAFLLAAATSAAAQTPLPSWNDGAAKGAILDFVAAVTDEGGAEYVPPAERVAVFDNDGTLWVEAPLYAQLMFALDRVRALAPEHPEWKDDPALSAAARGDLDAVAATGMKGVMKIVAATHSGMTTDEFAAIARAWIARAEHPTLKRRYVRLTYRPMIELLDHLRDNGFAVWIVSGGGVAFMRPWTEAAYGIPPERVIGSSVVTEFEMRDDGPALVRRPELFFLDDKEGKPVAIERTIGRRPIAAFGNSDGDLAMLRWTLGGEGRRLAMLLRHTDAEREFAYDRDSAVGRLDRGLDEAATGGWMLIDMKSDWNRVFAD